jgi:hypothetical protein
VYTAPVKYEISQYEIISIGLISLIKALSILENPPTTIIPRLFANLHNSYSALLENLGVENVIILTSVLL